MATRIRIKRGTESQITGYTGPHFEGELAYATNTGNVFVNDGTAFINIGGGGGEIPTLQSVTDEGNTTTNSIGIGTATPGYPLHIVTSNNSTVLGLDAGSAARFRFAGNSTSGYTSTFNIDDTGLDIGHDSTARSLNLKTGNQDRLTILGAGNVGIGTTAPTAKLHVVGTNSIIDNQLKLGNRTGQNGKLILQGNNGPNFSIEGVNDVLHYNLVTGSPNGGSIQFNNPIRSVLFNHSVGGRFWVRYANTANTDNNGGGLFIESQTAAGSNGRAVYVSADTNGGIIRSTSYGAIGTTGLLQFQVGGNTSNASNPLPNTKMVLDSAGNVGIGTTAPSEKLEVVGNIKSKDGIKLDYSSNTIGEIRGNTNTYNNFDLVYGAAWDGTNWIDTLGNYQSHKITLGTGGMMFYTGSGQAGGYPVSYTERMRIGANGAVAIGSTNTATGYTLYVAGNVGVSGLATTGDITLGENRAIRNLGSTIIDIDSNNDGTADYFAVTKGGYVSSTTLLKVEQDGDVIVPLGNVGIGTAAPALQSGGTGLHINAPTSSEIKFTNSTTGTTASDGTALVSNGTGFTINNREAGSLTLGTNNSTRLYIDSAGNVGIGNTIPSEKLHISGNVIATGGTVTAFASNTSKSIISNVAGGGRLQLLSDTGDIYLRTKGGDSYFNAGNVGIGTAAPDSKLHVKATSGIAFKVDPNSADKEWYIDTTNPDHLKKEGNLILNADPTNVHTSTKISFNIDGSNKASINSDGDLGVGTTAQTSKVHVDGTAMRQLRMGTSGGPSSNTDTSGAIGDMAYDDNYFYIKTINGWGRVPLDFGF